MCTRFQTVPAQQLSAHWGLSAPPAPGLPTVVAPTDSALVLHQGQLQAMRFGLIPHWAASERMGLSCLNARSETLQQKPSFRHLLQQGRCVVPALAYFEWKTEGKAKLPHAMAWPGQPLLCLAGLASTWRQPSTGQLWHTFSIITTAATPALAGLHHRMPVVLLPQQVPAWLDPGLPWAQAQALLQPNAQVQATPIARLP